MRLRRLRRVHLTSIGVLLLGILGGVVLLRIGAVRNAVDPPVALAQVPPEQLRYDDEYPSIRYAQTRPADAIAKLQERLTRGEVKLKFDATGRGYLDSLLDALAIDPSSQVLVFSKTSLQSRRIRPETPRAIYFNDDVYVAWVQQGPIEIGSIDPNLGAVYYLLEQTDTHAGFERELTRCLSCHDSYSLSGGGVPRLIVGSGYTGTTGDLVTHEGWILVTDQTPLKSRWGGWYVTGHSGNQVHLGNMVIRSYDDFPRLEELRAGNKDALDGLFDTKPYRTNKSDIVALLVLEHQVNVQNEITRVSWDTRTALDEERQRRAAVPGGAAQVPNAAPSAATIERLTAAVEPLLETMLFVDAVAYTAPISGLPEFVKQFEGRAVRDGQGRSLRDLDLNTRLFKYPLSYVIYSPAFEALPAPTKDVFYRRLADVLRGKDDSKPFADLRADDRGAILDILKSTKPDFARVLAN